MVNKLHVAFYSASLKAVLSIYWLDSCLTEMSLLTDFKGISLQGELFFIVYSFIICSVRRLIYINSYFYVDRVTTKSIGVIAACCFELWSELISFWFPLCDQPHHYLYDPVHLIFWWAVRKHHRHYHIPPWIHTNTHTSTHGCMHACNVPTSPRQLSMAPLLACSASYNVFSGCCVCTHRNIVITACQGFLCWETFAYSNVLRSEACHGWFSSYVHVHIVGFCSCSAQLMDPSGQSFSSFSPLNFHNEICLPKFMLRTCIFMRVFVHVWIPSYPCTNTFLTYSRFIPCQETLSAYK